MKIFNNDKNISILKMMMFIRDIEEELANRYKDKQMRCPMHLSIGQEGVAVGICDGLRADDKMFSNHRAHAHYLAKGGNPEAMVAEIYGKAAGCCGGRGGSMHLIDLSVGFMGATPIVGGTVPLAVGAAWAIKLKKLNNISIVFFGDGCFEEGVIHESLNFASLHNLPILFVCENNEFSVYTDIKLRQPSRPIYKVAEAHGINAKKVDGNNVFQVIEKAREMINLAREGKGPQFLECHTYRWREHCGPDFDNQLGYRSQNKIDIGHSECPIKRWKDEIKVSTIDYNKIIENNALKIEKIFQFALNSAYPEESTRMHYLYDN